ncbi:hypothetical protein LEP1GSC074_1315 [Leptospira noguchii str. Hook]|nr:hypothetical protein LEP1GSC074_1315 [Leptospira noguchii str. Hook]
MKLRKYGGRSETWSSLISSFREEWIETYCKSQIELKLKFNLFF